MADSVPASTVADGRGDFDFIFGRWQVHNRKLVDVTDPGCTDWVEFDAVSQAEPILGGLGHVDRIWAEAPAGGQPFEGFTLRQYDPAAGVWRIWWASSRDPGHLDPPVEGSWAQGRGLFFCDDVLAGRPVKVRFQWTHDGQSAARWEQAFSYDDFSDQSGSARLAPRDDPDQSSSWRVNWVMELTRVE